MDDATIRCVKVALRRRPGYPIGTPAPIYLLCPCGNELDIPAEGDPEPCAKCGQRFDRGGWIKES